MGTVLLIVIFLVLMAIIVLGIALINGAWQPIKDEQGETVELSKKQKVGVQVLIGAAIVGLFTLVLRSRHPWVQKMNKSMGRT